MKETLSPNTTLSHYRVLRQLGAGGMGEVYLAEDIQLDRKVALKLLPGEFTTHADRVRRFVQEAKAASALNHPNIITIYEIGETDGVHYIVTEFIEGETLRRHLERARITIDQALNVSTQIASALSAAHAAGIVHRDIKPENVMLRPDGYVKILDFGLAKLTEKPSVSTDTSAPTVARVDTHPGMVMGTISYMSPEQARGQTVDARSDIFSLGVVIYEMLAGRAPFLGGSAADVFVSILEKAPVPLAHSSVDVPAELERIVFKCIEKDRERRYASAQALTADLKALASAPSTEQAAAKRPASIAVLPFTNMSADPENEYFCDGLAEELLNSLAKIEALRVAARTSAFSFKGKDVKVGEVGRALNVATVLEGSVRKSGSRLRITAQLINVADGYHLWSERYDREMEDIFDIQDEISLAIVDALKVKLLGDEKAAMLKRYTENDEAYQLYLIGRFHYGKSTSESWAKSIEYYEQAIVKDPDFALAFAGIAISNAFLWFQGYRSSDSAIAQIKSAAAKALALDHSLSESHLSLAMLTLWYEWDWVQTEKELRLAIAMNPNNSEAHQTYAYFLAFMDRHNEAIAEANRALILDPLSVFINFYIGWVFWLEGRNDLALELGRKVVEMDAQFWGGYHLAGVAEWSQGHLGLALVNAQAAA
ncbi:MAG TPA: protein kinase, partial [Blastocatellia bacterium]|nr:protein kinase [Blastocatellia bacterium]